MDSGSHSFLQAHRAEHDLRLRKGELLRDAEHATGVQPARLLDFPVRAWLSAALITTGERLQEKIALPPTNTETIRTSTPSK